MTHHLTQPLQNSFSSGCAVGSEEVIGKKEWIVKNEYKKMRE
jgi:hypothetical protein